MSGRSIRLVPDTPMAPQQPSGHLAQAVAHPVSSIRVHQPTAATNQSLTLTLTWQASPGATFYAYCYDTTNDNTCSGWTAIGNTTSKSLTGLIPTPPTGISGVQCVELHIFQRLSNRVLVIHHWQWGAWSLQQEQPCQRGNKPAPQPHIDLGSKPWRYVLCLLLRHNER